MEIPIIESPIGRWSQAVLRRSAAMIPMGRPMSESAQQRASADHDIDRETLADDFVHGGVAVLIGRAEVAAQDAAEIAKVLFVERLIEMILALDIVP